MEVAMSGWSLIPSDCNVYRIVTSEESETLRSNWNPVLTAVWETCQRLHEKKKSRLVGSID